MEVPSHLSGARIKSVLTLLLAIFFFQAAGVRGASVEQLGFQWAKFGGGTAGGTYPRDISVDSSGNSYVIIEFPDNSEFNQTAVTSGGSHLVKINQSGQLVWKLKLAGGGLTQVWGREVAVTSDGNIVVAGIYQGTGTIAGQPAAPVGTENSLYDFFLLKVRPDATTAWLVNEDMNINGGVVHRYLATDPSGNIYAHTYHDLDVTIGGQTFVRPEFTSGYLISRYNSAGQRDWTRPLAFRGNFTCGPNGELYYVYRFSQTHQWGTETFTTAGSLDLIISRLNGDGSVAWAKQGGGSGSDTVRSLCTDKFGNLYVAGDSFGSVQFGGNTFPNAGSSSQDGFIVSYSDNGTFRWLRPAQGTGDETVVSVRADSAGNIHGLFNIVSGTATVDGEVIVPTGSSDIAVLTLNQSGQLLKISRSRGPSYEAGVAMGVGPDNQPVVGGVHFGTTYVDGFFGTNYGQEATFVGKVGPRRAPTVHLDPVSVNLPIGGTARFVAIVDASPPFTLQWKKNNSNFQQTSDPSLTISGVNSSHQGSYKISVVNDLGEDESLGATLAVIDPPVFVQPPAATNVWSGDVLRLGFTANSTFPYGIQWYRNSIVIDGATTAELVVNDLNISHEATYSVTISNAFGMNSASAEVRMNFIPIASHRDMVHDPVHNMLHITSGSLLNRFNVTNKTFISSVGMLGQVYGIDIAEDYELMALATTRTAGLTSHVFTITTDLSPTTNVVQLVRTNGATGIATRSVAFGHGYNLLATLDADAMPAFWVDAASRQSTVYGSNYNNAHVVSGAGRSIHGMVSTKTSPGQYYRLDADNQTQTLKIDNVGAVGTDLAVSRDGAHTLLCRSANVFDASGGLVASLLSGPGFPLGAVYHPQSNYVYCTWSGFAEIRVFETANYNQVGTIPIGTVLNYSGTAHPYAPGHLRISVDGNQIFCSLPDGIRIVNLPLSPPVIVKSPVNEAKSAGSSVTFRAQAAQTPGLRYQWQKDGQDILNATNSTYTISFIQGSDETNYRVRASNAAGFVYSVEAHLDVLKGDPQVEWSDPTAIVYGTLLGAAQLNASSIAGGTFTYDPPSGTKLGAGNGQVLRVVFVPTDSNAFEQVTNTVVINVTKKPLVITTSNASRQYGLPNPNFALNVSGLVTGDVLGDVDVLPVVASAATETSVVGTYPITITGGTDNNYSFSNGSGTLTVTKRTLGITISNLSQAYNGTPRPVTATTSPEGVALSIKYNNQTTVPTAIGSYPIVATPVDTVNYQGTASGMTLVIFKGAVEITWTPAALTYGTALGAAQLNASAPVAGIFSYTPTTGAILDAGQQTLTVVMTPTDSVNYLRTTNTVTLQVATKTLTATVNAASRGYGSANPALSGSLSGVRAGDNITATYTSAANLTSPVGTHAITPVFSDPNNKLGNYSVAVTGGSLTVTKVPLTIKANNLSRAYGASATYTATFTGLKNSDVIPITLSSTATVASAPGTYPITVALNDEAGLPTANYTVTLQEGTLTVTLDPSTIIVFSGGTATYVERSGAQLVDVNAIVTNVFEMSGAKLQVRTVNGQATEQVSLLPEGSGAGQIDLDGTNVRLAGVPIATLNGSGVGAGTLEIEFSALATMEQATRVLRRMAYSNTSGNPNPTSRSIEARLADINGGISDPANRSVTISLRNDTPVVTWVLPGADRALKAGHPVILEVNATDVDDTVSKVEFWINGEKVGERTAPPYRHTWTPTAAIIPAFKVVATDVAGDSTESFPPGLPYFVAPAIVTPRFTAGGLGEFRLDFIGADGVEYDVEVSSDFITWIKLTTITAQNNSVPVVDAGTLGVNRRFYRLVPKL